MSTTVPRRPRLLEANHSRNIGIALPKSAGVIVELTETLRRVTWAARGSVHLDSLSDRSVKTRHRRRGLGTGQAGAVRIVRIIATVAIAVRCGGHHRAAATAIAAGAVLRSVHAIAAVARRSSSPTIWTRSAATVSRRWWPSPASH